MDQLIDKFKIKRNNNLYNLNDIVTNIVKSKNVPLYINKVKNKQKILSHFYIDEKEFISILNKGKSKTCKEALNLFNNTKDIDTPQNKLDLQKNLLSFNGYKFLYFSVNDDIWFKGKDIATILEYENTKEAIIDHVLDEDKITFEKLRINNVNLCSYKIHPQTIFINKKGLESLVIGSRKPKSINFAKFLNININQKYPVKECEILNYIIDFLNERSIKYELQKSIGSYLLDMYLPQYNLNIEIDEYGHKDRCPEYEKNREDFIKLSLDCKILRFNPDDKNDNIFKFIGRLSKFDGIYKSECKEIYTNINDYVKYENKIEDYREEIISEDTDDVQLDIQREITKQKEYSYKEKEIELLTSIINKYDGKYLEEIILRHYNIMNTQLTNTQPMDTQEMDPQPMDIQEMDIQEMDTQPMDIQEPDSLIDSMSDEIKSNSSVIEEKAFNNKTKVNCEKKENKCLDCKTLVFRNSLRCLKCENIRRYDMNKGNRPSQQQILNDLKSMSYVKVGQKYGVSDNCIRKWLRKYERYST